MRLVYFCQNEGPFHMRWLDEMAKEIDVQIYHIGEYEKTVNPKYIDFHTKNAVTTNIRINVLGLSLFDLSKVNINPGDVVLIAGYGIVAQRLLILLFQLKRRRYILSADGGFIPQKEFFLKRALKRRLMSKASLFFSTCDECDKFLIHYGVDSKKIKRHYLSNVLLNDVFASPSTKEEKTDLRRELAITDKFTFISVGRLIPRKGFDILSDAMKLIDVDCQALIIGAEKDGAIKDMDKKIKLLDFKKKAELRKYYRAADVFVLPTRHDVWGLVISEAMACGLPVITTETCLAGVSMVENGRSGYIVPVEDSVILSERMKQIMTENTCKMGKEAINVVKKYCIETSAKRDVEVLISMEKDLSYDSNYNHQV